MKFRREWAMPNPETFSVPCIGDFVKDYIEHSKVSVDPFARNKLWATHTNDLNPNTQAESHMDAIAFLEMLSSQHLLADLIILDPPYSPRQISECYKDLSMEVTMSDTQSGKFYRRLRNAAARLCAEKCVVLSFGWNSVGMGIKRSFQIEELLLVCHGGAHNDTICMAERLLPQTSSLALE